MTVSRMTVLDIAALGRFSDKFLGEVRRLAEPFLMSGRVLG
jgi:hypothetical protein